MPRPLPLFVVLSVLLLSGVADGLWTDRWTAAGELPAAAERLAAVPMSLGDWDGRAKELDERTVALTEAAGYVRRQYVNRRTGSTVALLILCGRPGPLSVHSPEVCYDGTGYDELGGRTKYTQAGPPAADFWVYRFRKRDSAIPVYLRVLYCWGAAGAWQAVESPRLAFARERLLYKMYVVRELPNPDEPLQDDPALDFIRVLLPELQKSLLSP